MGNDWRTIFTVETLTFFGAAVSGAMVRWLTPPRPRFLDGLAKFCAGLLAALVLAGPVHSIVAPLLGTMDVQSRFILVTFTLGFMGERAVAIVAQQAAKRFGKGADNGESKG